MKKNIRVYWKALIRIGYSEGMDQQQETRLVTLNAFVIISILLTVTFVAVYAAMGSYSALEGLLIVPVLLIVLYCNYRRKHTLAGILIIYMLLPVVLLLAISDRRTGTEYILIALGCCSVLIFESLWLILLSFMVACGSYAFYVWYDVNHPFTPDPSVPYVLTQNSIMFLSGLTVVAQSLIFRSLIQQYAANLKESNEEAATANEELKASNEELLAFSENLDLMVRQKSAQLQAYVDAIDVSIYSTVSDFDGKFVKVNEQVITTSGYTKEELLGSHYSMLASGSHPENFFSQRRDVLMEGRVWRGEVEHKTKIGVLLWFDCIVIPIRDSDGAIKQFLTLGLPITERKLHQKLQEETLGLLEGIAFRASHSIRGPLARVKGLSDLVRKDMIDKNEFIEIAEKMVACSEELNDATSELVNYVYNHQEAMITHRK